MRVTTILKWFGLLIVALVVVAVAILYSIDVNSYRDEITAEFKKATGRDLTIGGEIDLSISLSPAVVVEEVAIANAEWGSRSQMVTLKRAEAQVELIPIITGDIRVTKLILVEPDILFETNADGVPNWQFAPPASDKPAPSTAAGEAKPSKSDAAEEAEAPKIPIFDHVEIRQGSLTYRNGQTGEKMQLDLTEVVAKAQSFTAPLTIDARGAWNQAPFSVSGSIESLPSLGSGRPFKLVVEAEAFGFNAKVAGAITEPGKRAGLDLQVVIGGANLSSLAPIAGPGLPKLGPINLNANVRGGVESLQIDNIKLALATSDLFGNAAISQNGLRPRITGTLAATKIDLTALLPKPSASAGSAGAANNVASAAARPGRVFPSDPLPLAGLTAVDLDLNLDIGHLITPWFAVDAVKAGVKLDGGALKVKPLSASVAASQIDGELDFDASRATASLELAIHAPDLDLGGLLKQAGVTDLFEGRAKLSADLAGNGRSVAALMAGLSGEIKLLAEDGRLKTQVFDAAIGGASAVLGTLFSGRKQWTVVNCLASSIDIKNGFATSRATLIDTEYATVIVEGSVNLASEALDLIVEPRAKSATLNVAVPVHVKGTLAEPSFEPDAGAGLRKLGGLLGIALFPPAAIAFLGELGSADNECVKIATPKQGAGAAPGSETGTALPTSPKEAIEKVKEGAEGLVKGVTSGLKSLLGGKKN